MKTTREGVFETNSSSTHSLTIGTGSNEFPNLNENGDIIIYLSQYGWEIEEYHSLEDRMSYVFSYLYNDQDDLFDELIAYIKENTDAKEVIFENTEWCYVDHGGEHMELNFDWLVDFMFNKGGYFETDNDNH